MRYHTGVNAARGLREARRRAGMTQRELAAKSRVPQPTIARIEAARAMPRVDMLDRLLKACGRELETGRILGIGLDRTLIRQMRNLSPPERARYLVESSRNVQRFFDLAGRGK